MYNHITHIRRKHHTPRVKEANKLTRLVPDLSGVRLNNLLTETLHQIFNLTIFFLLS